MTSPAALLATPSGGAAVRHLMPPGVNAAPVDLSIVVPALNEQVTIAEFVDWCQAGLAQAGVPGQILIVDSSTDETPQLALAQGAEVLCVPKRGLGRAYIDAIPFVRGRWIIMGDADLTYDFRDLAPWIERFKRGDEFIMGSRFKGKIEPDAMPKLHRYFGTPITTWLLNLIYGTHFSDIHCGMRGVTLQAFQRMRMRSRSWQYASEMIIKSVHLRLRTSEVPVHFHKDREGRVSNLKRLGWWAPWHAAWISVQAMFTYGADFFLFWPGLILTVLGLAASAALSNGPIAVGGIGFSLHWMLLFLLVGVVGFQSLLTGVLAKVLYDPERHEAHRWHGWFRFNTAVVTTAAMVLLGGLAALELITEYISLGYRLPAQLGPASYRAVAGMGLCLLAALYFTFSLVFNALYESTGQSPTS
jgi:glycosyltransferase involved in cell wall biosynthesis